MQTLSVQEVEYAAHRLAKELMTWGEPIPEFKTCFPNVLESCLSAPFQSFGGESPYKGLVGKASALFYLMIKNHPFQNGNKRIAVASLLILLFKNEKWMDVDNTELYNFAKWVASSPPKVKGPTIDAAKQFIGDHLIGIDEAKKRGL